MEAVRLIGQYWDNKRTMVMMGIVCGDSWPHEFISGWRVIIIQLILIIIKKHIYQYTNRDKPINVDPTWTGWGMGGVGMNFTPKLKLLFMIFAGRYRDDKSCFSKLLLDPALANTSACKPTVQCCSRIRTIDKT